MATLRRSMLALSSGAVRVGLVALLAACGGGGPGAPTAPGGVTPETPTIGPAGGTVSGGIARLEVPAGALGAPVALTVLPTTAVPLDPYAVIRAAVQLGPPGTAFTVPARLVLRYAAGEPPLGVDPRELRLHVLDGGRWRPLAGGAVDPAAGEVSAPVDAAGTYGARWVVGPTARCGGAQARQFDFWLGSWNLIVRGGVAGTNDITLDGCVIEEEFHEGSGTIGRSVSFLSSNDGQWYQTYIDSRGNRTPLRGQLEGPNMVLYHAQAGFRATWQPIDADNVRFFHETLSGADWRVTFDSTYVRR